MKKYLASISSHAELLVVAGCAFGPFFLAELASLAYPRTGPHHTNLSLVALAVQEIIVGGVLVWFLRLRGWTWEEFGLVKNSPIADAGVGALLFLASYFVWLVIWNVAALLSPELGATLNSISGNIIRGHIPAATSIVLSLTNGVFEEFFVVGYMMPALARSGKSPWFCINVSTATRLAYHLYQGPLGVLSIIPTGLLFAFWFSRTRRLWPLMFAHILMDMVALLSRGS